MIATSRCLLDAPIPSDREFLVRLYTDPRVRAYLGGIVDADAASERVSKLLASRKQHYAWAIREKTGGSFLGLVTLNPHHDGQDVELSYLFLPENQGRGYATEVVPEILNYAFTTLGLSRVVAETQMENAPSRRLLDRIGMRLERTVVRFGVEQGIYLAKV